MPAIRVTLINSNPNEISPEDWKEITYILFGMVIDNSPIDTGFFQDSWEIEYITDDITEIFNLAEYASFLEDGWSSQAPNGILEPALEKLPDIIRSVIGRRPRGQVTASLEIPDYIPR